MVSVVTDTSAPRRELVAVSNRRSYTGSMSTKDQTFSAALHGEALLRARRPELDPLIGELSELTQGRHDIRTECAGIIAGSWFAKPIIMGESLIAAGLLINAGPTEMDLLRRWLAIGFERGGGVAQSYVPEWHPTSLT
jgi:hypothetical protein